MRKLLITGAAQPSDELLVELGRSGWLVDIHIQETEPVITPEIYECVICNSLFLHNNIEKFTKLHTIQLTSAGLDRVPLDYINTKGIKLFNAKGVYSVPMAEWALGVILNHYKCLNTFSTQQNNHQWNKLRYLSELYGKNVAIIGAGNIGNEVAKRLQAFEAIVIGFDVCLYDKPYFNAILNISDFVPKDFDIVILTLPHTPESHHLINTDVIKRLKKGCLLINMSRGGLIDERALADVLKYRLDITAILDVFEEEPLSIASELWDMPNVKIYPHNSFVGENNLQRLHKVILNNLRKFDH